MYHSDKSQDICTFEVNKSFGDDESFFRLLTPAGEIFLNKLPFQIGQPLPDTLSCKIKGYNGDIPVVGHNMPEYVSEFYAEGASKGEEFEFKVMSVPDNGTPFYRLIDDHGLIFKLFEQKSALSKGQSVKCRFSVLDHKMFKLQRSDSEMMYSMVTLGDCARVAGLHNVNAKTIEAFLASIPELAPSLDELMHGRAHWIISAMRALRPVIPRLFKNAVSQHPHQHVSEAINAYSNVLLYLLQGSGFLRNVKGSLRNEIQAELTQQIEQLEIYKRTLEISGSRTQTKFIDNLLNNLKESGYIYHPTTQFSILMILFRMSPELINYSLGSIFDTLMGWDPDTWKAEPFRQAFVEQLEIYISETREDIDRFLIPETAEDNRMVERMITAIAIQHSLALDTDSVDMRLNRSLFYRYLSLLRSAKADVLLNKAYLALLDVPLPTDFKWADIKETAMLMTRAAVDPPKTAQLPENPRYFISGNIEVEIGREGINITKYGEDGTSGERHTLPERPGLSLNVDLRKNFTRARLKSLDGYAEFWNTVENEMFLQDSAPVEQVTRLAPDIGDIVKIVIDDVRHSPDDYNRITALVCRVVDDHFSEVEGIMNTGDLVTYKLYGVSAGTFRYENGEHMVFEARVTAIDDQDRYFFSMIETTKAVTRDLVNVGDDCLCVITRENLNSYSAISEKGCGLFVNKLGKGVPPFRAGNVIRVEITGFDNDAVQSEYLDGPIDNYTFSNSSALRNMLLAVAVRDNGDEPADLDEADYISHQDIREIAEIIRYAAVAQQDNILLSFNYLSYARLLALIINDGYLANEIKAHKEILLLHQHYAKNKSLFPEDITAAENIAPDSRLVARMAARLKIVAALGHPEEDDNLWRLISASDNEGDKELAHTVLSYNLLYEVNQNESTGTAIKDMIARKLNVSDEQRRLKYYGSESQYVEFKSSLVYPARKGRSGISLADPDKQEFEILHIIAGFLNSTGGNLYIGVSDDHYECGLADDLNFYKLDTSERNTPHRRNIKSLDNMANHLQQLIDKSFNLGGNSGNYAEAGIDEESEKGVIAVKIKACPHVVTLNDTIYVRHGSKTEPLIKEEEIAFFKADRAQLYRQVMAATAHESADPTPTLPKTPSQPTTEAEGHAQEINVTAPQGNHIFPLATSVTHSNVLHDWDDPEHFVNPVCYILFNNDNTFSIVENVWGGEEEDCQLILAITAEDARESLLLVYEGELAIRIRMKDLLDKPRNVGMPLLTDRKLIFASPIKSGDGLYSLHINSRGAIYERVTTPDKIASGFKPLSPERILEAECESSPFYEIIPEEIMSSFESLTPSNFKRNQIGSLAKGNNPGRVSIDELKASLIKKISKS